MKKIIWILVALVAVVLLAGAILLAASAGDSPIDSGNAEESTAAAVQTETKAVTVDTQDATVITLNGTTASVEGSGAAASDGLVTISAGGTYHLKGTFTGQILITASKNEAVTLLLEDASITSPASAAIYGKSECDVLLYLEGASSVSDVSGYTLTADDTGAAIFTAGNLTICGDGALTVNGLNNHGIQAKGNLEIQSGSLAVLSAGDGLKGKETVLLAGGTATIAAGGDGIQSSKANVVISGGSISVSSAGDGVAAETTVLVSGGTLQITAGGGSANSAGTLSTKGLKGVTGLTVTGGEVTIDSADDGLHSNGDVTISGGAITISTGDDGIHADATLTVEDGTLAVLKSYEGLEGADILIFGGDISITASDDGLNAAGGSSDDWMMTSVGGTVPEDTSGEDLLWIDGGTIRIHAGGDGVDSNGYLLVTGGTLLVDGPSDSANGALDYGITAEIRGGTVVAVGASGMATGFSSDSSQCSILYNFSASAAAGTEVTLCSADGTVLVQFTAAKSFNSVVISDPSMVQGETYTLTVGDTSETITLSAAAVTAGTAGGGMGGFGGQGGTGGKGGFGDRGGSRP